jgi:glycosyltransferase involved in cell wall biosynthesis
MMGAAKLQLDQNWLTREDLENLLYLAGFETIRKFSEIMWPVRTPWFDTLCNRYLVKLGLFSWLGLTNVLVARPQPKRWLGPPPVVSVIVPARNEAGNVRRIFEETPHMGMGTELIFVEGHSSDNTYETIAEEIKNWPNRRVKLFRQTGKGKGDAVRLGFEQASGDVLMILDADLTVPPEDLPRFYDAWCSGKGEFVNGVRLVYPMEDQSMRFFNLLGNKFFSMAFTWLLSQSVKDTLCGTKVLSKRDYEMIAANRSYFGDFDPFGDFDLLFGAAKYSLKIVDLPIRYRERTYGTTNIERWKHGWLLLQMVAMAMRKIKFV